jgi:hypothetical protein
MGVSQSGEKPRVTASVEVAGEIAEAVLELDVPAVRAPVVDDEDAEILERALEHASASFPRGAGGRELVERIGAVGNANAVDAAQNAVKRARPASRTEQESPAPILSVWSSASIALSGGRRFDSG